MERARRSEPFASLRTFASLRETRTLVSIILPFILIATCAISFAQTKKKKAPTRKHQSTMDGQLARAQADLASAAKDYKDSLQKLLGFQKADVRTAEETLEKRRALYVQNIIHIREVEESERSLEIAKAKVRATLRDIAEADLFSKSGSNQSNSNSQNKVPYRKETLLRVLALNALPMREIEEAVKTRGVGFRLTPDDEATFSSVGATRELLRIIASNYHARE